MYALEVEAPVVHVGHAGVVEDQQGEGEHPQGVDVVASVHGQAGQGGQATVSAATRRDHGAGPAGTDQVTNGGRRGTSGAATLGPLRHAGAPQRDGCSNGTGAPAALAYVNPHSGMDRDPVSISGEQCAGGGDGRRAPGRGSGPVGATDLGVQQPEPDPGDPAAAVVGVRALAPACRYLAPAVAAVPAGQRGLVADSLGYRYQDDAGWLERFAYEYLKDVRTFALFVALEHLASWLGRRRQGEASLLAEPDVGVPVEPVERPQHFLVRKLGKEFLVATEDVEYAQAAGNYVNLHVRGHDYPLRITMAVLEQRLDPGVFLRPHRSWIINRRQLRTLEPLEGGEALLHMADGVKVPCSRRQLPQLRLALAGG
ncbi:hypothetical protein G6F22_014494 [Rhizopus arrhizus]|nr:hypothetical protein G6F22_014494 [Rhizopus arrhizus]